MVKYVLGQISKCVINFLTWTLSSRGYIPAVGGTLTVLDPLVTRSKHVMIYLPGTSVAGHCYSCNAPSVILREMNYHERKVYLTDFISELLIAEDSIMKSESRNI